MFTPQKPWQVGGSPHPRPTPNHHKSQDNLHSLLSQDILYLLGKLALLSPRRPCYLRNKPCHTLLCVCAYEPNIDRWSPSQCFWVTTRSGTVSRMSRQCHLQVRVFLLSLWLANWLCCHWKACITSCCCPVSSSSCAAACWLACTLS